MLNTVKAILLKIVEQIDNEEISSNEADTLQIVELLKKYTETDKIMSKYLAYTHLGISRANFDRLVAEGKIPKGQKIAGFKELQWKLSDLDKYKKSQIHE